jgi:hypothetical protein
MIAYKFVTIAGLFHEYCIVFCPKPQVYLISTALGVCKGHTLVGSFVPLYLVMETDPVSETFEFAVFETSCV